MRGARGVPAPPRRATLPPNKLCSLALSPARGPRVPLGTLSIELDNPEVAR